MHITEEGALQLIRLQDIDVTTVQPRRNSSTQQTIDKTMMGLVKSLKLWIMAYERVVFRGLNPTARVIKDMNWTANEMDSFALEFQYTDEHCADYAYKR
jgi:hypothetical protein